jgi:hypothetical protein
MPSVIGELDVTVIAAEVGDAMSARLEVRLRYLPISRAAVRKRSVMHEDRDIRRSPSRTPHPNATAT